MPPATTGSAGTSAAHTGNRLEQVLRPLVVGAGYDLDEVSVTAAGRRSVVRVVVDAEGGIDLDGVAQVSRAISSALDEQSQSGVLAGAYVLEVSSPGIDRPLREARHWRRAIGRLVTVAVGGAAITGRVVRVGDEGVELRVAGDETHYDWDVLGPGRVQVEFNRADADGAVDAESDTSW